MGIKTRAGQLPFLLFVGSLPFASVFEFNFPPVRLQISDLLFLTAVGFGAVRYAVGKRKVVSSGLYFPAACYAAAVTLAAITSVDPSASAVKLAGKFYLIGAALLTMNEITTVEELKRTVTAWLFGAGVALSLCLVGIVLFYAGMTDPSRNIVLHPIFGSLPPGWYPRIEGFFFYPAMLCNFLGITWMFALMLASAKWLRARVVYPYAAGLFIVDLFTLTPGLGGIFLSTGNYLRSVLLAARRASLARLAAVTGIAISAAFFFAASVTLFSGGPEGTNVPLSTGIVSPSHRAVAWQTAFEKFLEHPVLGYGIGMPIARSEYTTPSGQRQLLVDAHNTYISLLGESGLAGFLSFMGIVTFLTLSLVKWKPEDMAQRSIRICLLLALCDSFYYQSLTGSFEDARHLWVFFGIVAATVTIYAQRNRVNNTDAG